MSGIFASLKIKWYVQHMHKVQLDGGPKIKDYKSYASLSSSVEDFLEDCKKFLPKIKGNTIWMINSTETGGGVAEMLPSQLRILREQGVKVEWLVMETKDEHFFELTKRIHNAIHGSGSLEYTEHDKSVYDRVSSVNAKAALQYIKDGDMVVAHDPQPAGMIQYLKKSADIKAVWRCHIGIEHHNDVSDAVWQFMKPIISHFDHFVFSIPRYVPKFIKDNFTIIPAAIDPLSHKNRTLQLHKCIGILHQSRILNNKEPVIYDFYKYPVRRVTADGSFGDINDPEELDVIYRPSILQVSRWDKLKGFKPLMEAFVKLKEKKEEFKTDEIHRKRIQKVRLILAGPDPEFVTDDPQGKEVLDELKEVYKKLERDIQKDIAILLLPMNDPKQNALIVNALQRSSSVIVQNSIQEGFGLTATEAMWKQIPIIVSNAAGLKFQVEHKINGIIIDDATDTDLLAKSMNKMLSNPKTREKWGFNGQIRVIENFTVFSQLKKWLELFARLSS